MMIIITIPKMIPKIMMVIIIIITIRENYKNGNKE